MGTPFVVSFYSNLIPTSLLFVIAATNRGAIMSNPSTLPQDRPAVDVALLLVRVTVGVIFAAHGSQKLFGAFDGPGLAKTVEMMGPIGYLVTVGEFFGGLGLVF